MPPDTGLTDCIAGILRDALHLEPPPSDLDLFETGVLDSLAFVELLLRLEQDLGVAVSVDDLELENFRTIERIAAFVAARAAAHPLRLVHAAVRR